MNGLSMKWPLIRLNKREYLKRQRKSTSTSVGDYMSVSQSVINALFPNQAKPLTSHLRQRRGD